MSRVTRTPISSSKGQRSRSQGRRHIVAASRTFCYLRPPVDVMLSYETTTGITAITSLPSDSDLFSALFISV